MVLASVNIFGGFTVTQRMLGMFKQARLGALAMSANVVALGYLVAAVCFILALRGLSSPATARQGNRIGIAGMAIAILFTLFAPAARRASAATC